MKIRPATDRQCRAARKCEELLRDALSMAKTADCPKTAARIRKAINSANGAVRHVKHRAARTDKTGRALTAWTGTPYGSSKNKRAEAPKVYAWQTRADLR